VSSWTPISWTGRLPPKVVFDDPDPPTPTVSSPAAARRPAPETGKLCFFPRAFGHNHQFVVADDTYREACIDRNPTPGALAASPPW